MLAAKCPQRQGKAGQEQCRRAKHRIPVVRLRVHYSETTRSLKLPGRTFGLGRGLSADGAGAGPNSAAERSVASHNSRSGRVRVEFGEFSKRARAFAGNEYFSRRCCRKVSADRSRIEFPPLTLLLEYNSSHVYRAAFALDLFSSKNIIVAQIFERPGHGGSGVFFQSSAALVGVFCPKWLHRFRACVQG